MGLINGQVYCFPCLSPNECNENMCRTIECISAAFYGLVLGISLLRIPSFWKSYQFYKQKANIDMQLLLSKKKILYFAISVTICICVFIKSCLLAATSGDSLLIFLVQDHLQKTSGVLLCFLYLNMAISWFSLASDSLIYDDKKLALFTMCSYILVITFYLITLIFSIYMYFYAKTYEFWQQEYETGMMSISIIIGVIGLAFSMKTLTRLRTGQIHARPAIRHLFIYIIVISILTTIRTLAYIIETLHFLRNDIYWNQIIIYTMLFICLTVIIVQSSLKKKLLPLSDSVDDVSKINLNLLRNTPDSSPHSVHNVM